VNAAFDRECNQDEYEKKIAGLIGRVRTGVLANDRDELDAWTEAVRTLQKEDHYLLVMISAAGESVRPRHDLLRLLLTALSIVCILVAIAFFAAR